MSKAPVRFAGLAWMLLAVCAGAAHADPFISELCDPKLDYASDRFIEIYNPGPEAVDLAGWKLVAVANGVEAFTWNLSGLIDADEALVAGDATTVDVFPVAFADEAWSGSTGNWNGKVGDGARLVNPSGTVTDEIVAAGTAFENADYVRRPEIDAPNPVYEPAEWTSTPANRATDGSPGVHQTSSPGAGPALSGLRTDPEEPGPGEAVHVLADVVDDAALVVAVTASWGTAATSLPDDIAMEPVGGDTYRTVTPIPPQAGGTTVYYRVEAANDLPAISVSDLRSFALPVAATVRQIQGEAAASPFDGSVVATQGVVTAVYGSTFVIQDGPGPWSGLWVRGAVTPARGDSVAVTGRVTESDGAANAGNTMLVDAVVTAAVPGAALPDPVAVSTASAASEAYEGVLVEVVDAICTDAHAEGGGWDADDGSGPVRIGTLGDAGDALQGTAYRVRGPVGTSFGRYVVEPRDADDLFWLFDHAAPTIEQVGALNDTALAVAFSEPVDSLSAGTVPNYSVTGLDVTGARRDPDQHRRVLLAVSPMATGEYTLTVTGVEDLYGNAIIAAEAGFSYTDPGIPAGYYDAASGMSGAQLRSALHDIIKDHTAYGYDYAWTAYRTTDARPDDDKVWDIYSDIPGGTPAYLYTFGVDEGGVGGAEGTGYTREHTWCKSWFGGEVSPMYTDLFALYPCDTHMNGTRGVFPYGETAAPQFVSTNGSRVGPGAVPGYTGTVFEPIDDFKGDLARVYFYFSTRYYLEDAGWPGGPATDGADLRPWALEMFLEWNAEDPVSRKEIDRNNAVYSIQGNRNPFVDRPEFVSEVFGQPTGVVLSASATRLADGTVRIAWATARDDDSDRYDVYRGGDAADRRRITDRPLDGRAPHEFLDREAPHAATAYWIASHERDGTTAFSGPFPVGAWEGTGRALFEAVVPNPFAGSAAITYRMEAAGRVRAEVFDLAGRRILLLRDGREEAGRRTLVWDGRDARGVAVGAGVYFIRLAAGDRAETRRVVRVRR